MRRRWIIVAGVVGAMLVGAVFVMLVLFHDTTTPIDATALGFTGTVGDAPGDPGIYVYDTTGFDEIDALGGARHDYPADTYLVITDGPCGPIVKWQAIEERWVETEHCGPDLAVTTERNFHKWFGVPDTGVTDCLSPIFPTDGETTWTTVCTSSEESTSTDVVTVVGTETLNIGGQEVETVHLHIVSTTEGSSVGTTTTDEWRLPGTPLVVQERYDDVSANDTRIGTVNFEEHFVLRLRSLLPSG